MKILQINAVYGIGSTGHIVQDIHTRLLAEGHDSFVMWAIQCIGADDPTRFIRIGSKLDHKVHAMLRRLDGGQGFHSKIATIKACKRIKEINPDVVHLHNLHSNYIHFPTLLHFLGEEHIPVWVTLHDCWFFTGQCTYYQHESCLKWRDACKGCKLRHSSAACKKYYRKQDGFGCIDKLGFNGVSEWTTSDGRESSILRNADLSCCIYNWVDTKKFCPRSNSNEIRDKYNIEKGKKLILGVSQSWSSQKGLNEFIRLSEAMKDTTEIILVGEGSQVPQRENIRCIGFTNNQEELIELYSAADVFVNPSRMETFGLVTVEALACGTPVVAYDNTGSHEIVNDLVGALADDGNIEDLIEKVKRVVSIGKKTYYDSCLNLVRNRFELQCQVDKYIHAYKNLHRMR